MKKRFFSSALTLAVLCATSSAQSQANRPVKVQGQPGHATIDMATGVVTRGTQNKAASLVTIWANTDYAVYYGLGFTPVEEWLDWGVISTTSGSDIVGEFQFGYATTAIDTSLGGPGASMCTNFYNGATGSCAESGLGIQPDATFCWSGLPGATTSSQALAWLITVDVTGGSEFQMGAGPFGFALAFQDGITGPLLCYAGDGTGIGLGPDGNGQTDRFDIYTPDLPSGTCATYWYGGLPLNMSSWWLYIATADGTATGAACTWYCGTGINPNGFTVSSNAVVGGNFDASVTAAGSNGGAFLAAYSTPLALMTPYGELLVNISDANGELLGIPSAIGNPAFFSLAVPLNLDLCGFTFYVQAGGFGGAINLHCAYACLVGF